MSRTESGLQRRARALGIKDPQNIPPEALGLAVRLYEQANNLRSFAREMGIELPEGTNIGTLQRIFTEKVAARLQHVTVGTPVRYKDRDWEVQDIRSARGLTGGDQTYVLRPLDGGRPVLLSDRLLARHLYRNSQ